MLLAVEKWDEGEVGALTQRKGVVPFVSQITLLIMGFGITPFHTAKVTVLSSI